MKFCEREIEMAQKLHALNLQWHPQAGNYVFDIKGIIEKSSPFQTGVYFILDIKHFLRRAGSPEANVSWSQVENRLIENSAFQNDSERVVLYEMILERLQ
ncbi:MAG: hypothetical protein ACYSOC_02425 [Planctomycetota bacterium]|jgi:hypothetical protein